MKNPDKSQKIKKINEKISIKKNNKKKIHNKIF